METTVDLAPSTKTPPTSATEAKAITTRGPAENDLPRNYTPVKRISSQAPDLHNEVYKTVMLNGEPIIIEHDPSLLVSFNATTLRQGLEGMVFHPRNVNSGRDLKNVWSVKDYLDYVSSLPTPSGSTTVTEGKERILYAKDLHCPQIWSESLFGQALIHPEYHYRKKHSDLSGIFLLVLTFRLIKAIAFLPPKLQAENLMVYLGTHLTK